MALPGSGERLRDKRRDESRRGRPVARATAALQRFAILFLVAVSGAAQPPHAGGNFLRQAFGTQPLSANPLLSSEFPRVSLLFANRAAEVEAPRGGEAVLRAPGSEAILVARLEHQGVFDLCRI